MIRPNSTAMVAKATKNVDAAFLYTNKPDAKGRPITKTAKKISGYNGAGTSSAAKGIPAAQAIATDIKIIRLCFNGNAARSTQAV